MSIGERIKRVRGDLTQGEFSKRLGVSKMTVGRWERGERVPDQAALVRILEEFPSINIGWLTSGGGPMLAVTAGVSWTPENANKSGEELMVSEENLQKISKLIDEKLGDRRSDLSGDKTLTLIMLLYRFYSRNFIESEKFRQETMAGNIERMVWLALED